MTYTEYTKLYKALTKAKHHIKRLDLFLSQIDVVKRPRAPNKAKLSTKAKTTSAKKKSAVK
jgi:hypothetical protein